MNKGILASSALLLAVIMGVTAFSATPAKKPYRLVGTYVEGCECNAPCGCEISGLEKGCQGVSALKITSGSYDGKSLAGAKVAIALAPGDWTRVYVDAMPSQRPAVSALARAIASGFGKVEAVKYAPVSFSGKDGSYNVAVEHGIILQLTTKPILGADGKRPVAITNVKSALSSTFYQGKSVKGSFKDGGHDFTLAGTNSYFYPVNKSGRM